MAVDVVRFQSNEREKISDCGTPRLNFLVFFVEVYRQARFTFAILLGRHEVERSEGLLSLPGCGRAPCVIHQAVSHEHSD